MDNLSNLIYRATGARRLVKYDTPRGRAHCEKCHMPLSYEYGSIAWEVKERDLCPSCRAEEDVKQASEASIRALAQEE